MGRISFLVILFLSVFNTYGFQWPVSDVVLISTFGGSEFGGYVKGLNLGGQTQDVKAIDSGELVYYSYQSASPLDLPSGLGSFVIYQHNNGIRSLYGHLEDSSLNTTKYQVSTLDKIGTMGFTGTAIGAMLYLQVIDTEFKKYINPLLSLPLLPDQNKPLINKIFLSLNDSRLVLGQIKSLKTGIYELSADIRDLSDKAGYYCPLAPFSISIFMNGENLANIDFESMKVREGQLLLQDNDKWSYKDLYNGDWEVFIGSFEFNPGDIMIEISVKDFAGNESIEMFSLKITE
jgi:Peptidase family M23